MSAAATRSVAQVPMAPPSSPLHGHTPCQIVTIAMQLPNGSIQPRVCLVPYVGPIPAQTQVLTSLQQLQQFQLLTPSSQTGSPTLVPSSQPQTTNHLFFQSKQTASSSAEENKDESRAVDQNKVQNSKVEAGDIAEAVSEKDTIENEEVSDQSPSPSSVMEKPTVVTNVQETEETHVEKDKTDVVPEPTEPTTSEAVAQPKTEPSAEKTEDPAEKTEDPEPSKKVPLPIIQPKKLPPAVEEVVPNVEAKDFKCEEEFPSLGGPSSPRAPRRIMSSEALSSICSEAPEPDSQENYTKAKIYTTRKRIRVRSDKTLNAEEVGILEKNTRVQLLYISGRKGRIVHPINGWVSMKKKKEKQLVQIFCGTPAVEVSNMARSLNRESDVLKFLRNKKLRPTRCVWRKNEDFARVEFSSHSEATKLIKGSYICDNVKLAAKWDEDYELTVDL